jgi:hypothetical protein
MMFFIYSTKIHTLGEIFQQEQEQQEQEQQEQEQQE